MSEPFEITPMTPAEYRASCDYVPLPWGGGMFSTPGEGAPTVEMGVGRRYRDHRGTHIYICIAQDYSYGGHSSDREFVCRRIDDTSDQPGIVRCYPNGRQWQTMRTYSDFIEEVPPDEVIIVGV